MEAAFPRRARGRGAIRPAPAVGQALDGRPSERPRGRAVAAARQELTPLFDPVRPRLAELVRNPFNLNLAAGLLSGNPSRVYTVRSELDLLPLYWGQRVATGPETYGRLGVLEKLAREMIRQRRDRLHPPHDNFTNSDLAAIQGLLSNGVLREDQPPGYASTSAPVAFAHALLFDFTVANQVLARPEDPMHLAGALAAEPDWALLLRSSVELHLAALWHGDPTRESFFALAARLTTQNPLAANAAAEIPLRERLGLPDLEPLISYCLAPRATAERLAARRFTSQLLAGALHLRHLPPGRGPRRCRRSTAARRLAEAAEQDHDIELARPRRSSSTGSGPFRAGSQNGPEPTIAEWLPRPSPAPRWPTQKSRDMNTSGTGQPTC